MALTFESGITIEGGISAGPNVVIASSFLLSSSDFTNGQPINTDTTSIGTNGNEGFENTAAQGNFSEGYYGYGITPTAITRISAAITAAGIDPTNSSGYVWAVEWAAGSTISIGLAKFGFYNGAGDPNNAFLDIQTIDPTDTDWQIPGNANGTTLVGTFLFPATFTIYTPLTNKGGWC